MLQPQKNPAIAGFPRIYTLHFLSYIFLKKEYHHRQGRLALLSALIAQAFEQVD